MASSIKDIAIECNLSAGAVSDILNRNRADKYIPATRDKVIAAASKLNYRPNRAAQSMRSKKNKIVGFVTTNITYGGFFENHRVYPFMTGISQYFVNKGYHVANIELEEMELHDGKELPAIFREHFLDGLIIHYGLSRTTNSLIPELGIPTVWWDSGIFELQGCIQRDEMAVGEKITEHFIKLGHQRIAFLAKAESWQSLQNNQHPHFSFKERVEGYQNKMKSCELETILLNGYDPISMAEQIKKENVTAILTLGNTHSFQIILAATRYLNLRIPEDLSVATLDIEALMEPYGFQIGGMTYNRYQTGQTAAGMLSKMIDNPHTPANSIKITSNLINGDTIAPPNSKQN